MYNSEIDYFVFGNNRSLQFGNNRSSNFKFLTSPRCVVQYAYIQINFGGNMFKSKNQLSDIKTYELNRSGIAIGIGELDRLLRDLRPENDRYLLESFMVLAESDAHFSNEFSKRTNAVSGLKYRFTNDPSGNIFRMFDDHVNLNQLISSMMQAVIYGFAPLQISWMKDGAMYVVDKITMKPPHLFNRTLNDEITIYRDGIHYEELAENQWIIHRHNYCRPVPYFNGVMRALAKHLIYKRMALSDKDKFLSTYGIPIKIGKYPVGTCEEDQDKFQAFLEDLSSNTSGSMCETYDVQVVTSDNTTADTFDSMIRYVDNQISMALNAGALTTTATNVGSRALGEVVDKGRLELIADDAKQIVRTLNTQLLPLYFKALGMSGEGVRLELAEEVESAGAQDEDGDKPAVNKALGDEK